MIDALTERLRRRGAVLLRGYAWELPDYEAFARALAPGAIRYGGSRDQVSQDDSIQRAERGMMEISLHSELAFTPLRPDTAFFACRRPAREAGQTFVADGRNIARMLSPGVHEQFVERRVRYHRRYPASAWRRLFGAEQLEDIRAHLETYPDFGYEVRRGGVLDTWYTTSAFSEDLGGERAFCNNVSNMVEAEGIEGSTVTFEDGAPIEGALRAELRWVLRLHRRPIGWQPGDLLVIDNRRVMHGREAFDDPAREIWVRFANLQSDGIVD